MNRNKAEKIAAIVLLGVLCIIFVIQNAHALSTTCPVDNGKCLTIDEQLYQFGCYVGKQVDYSRDSTAPVHIDQYMKGYADAYNGATT